MKPRTDQVGLILTPEEADLAVKLDYASRMQEVNDGVAEQLRSAPIDIDLTVPVEEFMLDEQQAERLWGVAFWAAATYLEGYREVDATYNEICQSEDIRRQVIAEYLCGLEIMMYLEAEHYKKAETFAYEIDQTRALSRSYVLSEHPTTS